MNRTKGILVLLSSVIFQSEICGQQTRGQLDPQSAEAHLGLGKALEKKGQLKEALEEYRGAVSLEEGRARYEKLAASSD